MSSNLLHNNDDLASFGNKNDSYASLDAAFSQSPHMSEFQEKLYQYNPLAKKQASHDILSSQSEDKINSNIDEIVGAMCTNRDFERSERSPVKQFSAQAQQAHMIENFDLEQSANNLVDDVNRTTQNITGMSFFKALLLLILIIVLVYAAYCLFFGGQNGNGKQSVVNIKTSGPGSVSLSEQLQRYFR